MSALLLSIERLLSPDHWGYCARVQYHPTFGGPGTGRLFTTTPGAPLFINSPLSGLCLCRLRVCPLFSEEAVEFPLELCMYMFFTYPGRIHAWLLTSRGVCLGLNKPNVFGTLALVRRWTTTG
jgi:hypothetical protein